MERSIDVKARWKLAVLAVVATALVLSVAGVALADSSEDATVAPAVTLSPHVEKHLVVLREEEKLARDVYTVLYARWGAEVFDKIAAAESRHMAAVEKLLDRYGIEDPVGSNPPGVFTNEKIQAAYTELVAKGMTSLDDAYRVGRAIEKADIALLRDLLGDTNRRDVTFIARNLLRASQDHLAVFTRLLNK
jgi:hypothetical protein